MSRNLLPLLLLKHMGIIKGNTQFQKLMFLLNFEYNIDTRYVFEPWKYGPYCEILSYDVDTLTEYGYIYHEKKEQTEGEKINRYQLTEYGEQCLLEHEINQSVESIIEDLCQTFGNLALRELIEYIYEKYPKYTIKSEIKDEYYHPNPKLSGFKPANELITKPTITPSFVDWLEEELKETKEKMNVIDAPVFQNEAETPVDEIVLSMLDIAYEDLNEQAQNITTEIALHDYEESGNINNQIYFILEMIHEMLNALTENDIIGVFTEFANIQTNIQMLHERLDLHALSLKSELIRKVQEFMGEVNYLLESIDKLIML